MLFCGLSLFLSCFDSQCEPRDLQLSFRRQRQLGIGDSIVVATPGRLLDLIDQNALRLADVQHLVLDEADRLLDLGFADELQRVLALLPAKRQTLLFSATFAPEVQALAAKLLREPVRITVEAFEGHQPDITQRAIAVDEKSRTALLRHLITENGWQQVLVFVATRYACEHVAGKLYKAGIYATPFHGEMSQGARQEVLHEFKEGRWDVVVTTDLASRGIDIALLPVVVNYDLPRSATDLSLIQISEPTRLTRIPYAVFCLKKKKKKINTTSLTHSRQLSNPHRHT